MALSKSFVLSILSCPDCRSDLSEYNDKLVCTRCKKEFPLLKDKPVFTPVPSDIIPAKKKKRGPDTGSMWRRANWKFYERAAKQILPDKIVLDIGIGQGGVKPLFTHTRYIGNDIYPYDDVDFICDITKVNPIRDESVDVVILSNVLEHVADPVNLLKSLSKMLRPAGRLLITVPFIIKVHQAPFDFMRYTHFALYRMLSSAGYEIVRFEAVYLPFSLVNSMVKNLLNSFSHRYSLRGIILGPLFVLLKWNIKLIKNISASILEPIVSEVKFDAKSNPYPVGYQIEALKASDSLTK